MKYYSLSLLTAILAGSLGAASIGNGPPNQSAASELNAFLEADDFTLSSVQDISNIRFWSLESAGSFTGNVAWAIYSNVSGAPGVSLLSGLSPGTGTATGNVVFGFDEVRYDVPVAISSLAAGTYWLVLHNGPDNTTPAGAFYWAWQDDALSSNSQNYDLVTPGPWVSNFAELAFELTTNDPVTVPEPSTFGLVAACVALAGVARHRQTRLEEKA